MVNVDPYQCGPKNKKSMWTRYNVDLNQCGPCPMWTNSNVDNIQMFWSKWTTLKYFGQCGPHWNILVDVDKIKIGQCGQSKIYIKYNYLQFIKLGCCGQHNDYLVIVDHFIKKSHCGQHYKKVIVDLYIKKSLWTTY